MLKVRFLCSQCHRLTEYTPAIQKDSIVEALECFHCRAYVGDLLHIPDKEEITE